TRFVWPLRDLLAPRRNAQGSPPPFAQDRFPIATGVESWSRAAVASCGPPRPATPAPGGRGASGPRPHGRTYGGRLCSTTFPVQDWSKVRVLRVLGGCFAQRLEHDRIDLARVVDALLEILDAGEGAERLVAEPVEPLADLRAERAVERQPVLARRHPEQAVVQLVDAPQLLDRLRMIVDTQIDDDVGQLRVAARALH